MNDTTTHLDIEEVTESASKKSCEHSLHTKQKFCHADGDETFVLRHCPAGCYESIRVYCGRYIQELISQSRDVGTCRRCGAMSTLGMTFTILGPANGDAK